MTSEPDTKRVKTEPSDASGSMMPPEKTSLYEGAVATHPFYDRSHSAVDVYSNGVFRDGKGQIVGILIRQAIPEEAAVMAANVLRPAATKSSLRSTIYGGESPNSGIAGYFDYRGSPIAFKSRKTSFTAGCSRWSDVFPMVNYVNDVYRNVMPHHWEAQNAAIPDLVRINGSVFSTLTINSKFRTAHHTDTGDYDGGYSCIACLEGQFKGVALTFDEFHISFSLKPRDLIIFNPHHFHSNTEVESDDHDNWSRLTCVFYYRAQLGEPWSYAEYERRYAASLSQGLTPALPVVHKPNGVNQNKAAVVDPVDFTPFSIPVCVTALQQSCGAKAARVHSLLLSASELAVALFGEPLATNDGVPIRLESEKVPATFSTSPLLGFRMRTVTAGDEKQGEAGETLNVLLDESTLMDCVTVELYEMWTSALRSWLSLLEADWAKLLSTNPSRTTFTWNNRGAMNQSFFDFCDVAKEVMRSLWGDDVSKQREHQFWGVFAVYASSIIVEKKAVPQGILPLEKLTVKVKDYLFGGTRYFKDMPEAEQRRRVERVKTIEQARKDGTRQAKSEGAGREWLLNDSFDYQSEDKEVDFAALGLPSPTLNTADRIGGITTDPPAEPETVSPVTIVVVTPPEEDVPMEAAIKQVSALLSTGNHECSRLLCNSAALRMVCKRETTRLDERRDFNMANVTVQYVSSVAEVKPGADFVILRHVLSAVEDDVAAEELLASLIPQVRGCVMLLETDLACRNYYTINPATRQAYDAAAADCFSVLHRVHNRRNAVKLRTSHEIEAVCGGRPAGRYKFIGSALNSVVYVLHGSA